MKKVISIIAVIVFATSVAFAGTCGTPGGPEQTFVKGDKGDKGDPGARGKRGSRGYRGRRGPAGPAGPAGKVNYGKVEKRIAQLKAALREEMRECDRKGAERIANELELLTSRCDGLENMSIDMRDDIDEMRADLDRMNIRLDDTRDIAIEGATRAKDAMDLGCALVVANGGQVNYTVPAPNPATPDQPAAQAPGAPVAPEGQPGMNLTPDTATPDADEAPKAKKVVASGWWKTPLVFGAIVALLVGLMAGGSARRRVGLALLALIAVMAVGWLLAPSAPAPAVPAPTQVAPVPTAPTAPAEQAQSYSVRQTTQGGYEWYQPGVGWTPCPPGYKPVSDTPATPAEDERAADYGRETPVPSTG